MAERSGPYPFPSKIHVASSVTIKLNDRNYLLWKTQLESLLRSQKLLGFVTGQTPSPAATITTVVDNVQEQTPNPDFEIGHVRMLIKSWLFGTLTEEVLGYVHCLPTSQEVWLSLANNFNRSSIAREFELKRRLQLMSLQGKDFQTYCREFRGVCDQLSSIGKPVDESLKIFSFMNGLGREYDPICTVVQSSMSRLPTPTFNDAVSEISGFASRLQSYESTVESNPHMAFQTQRYNNNNRGRGGYSRAGFYRGGYSSRGRGGYSSRGRGFSQHQNNPPPQYGERPTCQICGRIGHTALKCYNRFDHHYQTQQTAEAFSSLRVSDQSGKEWFPDSGASAHVTSSTNTLQNVSSYDGNDTILVADGTYLPITHTGSATISSPSEGGLKGSST